ncbi:MAG: ABC-2 transporter permease [Sphaerochaeta sp.]
MNVRCTLLLKEWFILKRKSETTLFIVAFFTVFAGMQGGFLYTAMCTIMLVMLTLTSFAYDQSDGWEAYVSALPVSRKVVVQSKYLFGFLMILISILLVMVSSLVFRGTVSFGTIQLQLFLGVLFLSLNYPLIVKFGFEKSRVWYMGITVVVVGVGSALSSVLGESSLGETPLAKLGVWVIAGILLILSYVTSMKMMERKQFVEN